jgi:hypothetical protein
MPNFLIPLCLASIALAVPLKAATVVPTYIAVQPTPATPQAPATLSRNVFKPSQGPLGISFKTLKTGNVTVRIYSMSGARVRTLVAASPVGNAATLTQASWDGRDEQGRPVASGLYVVSIQGAGLQSQLKVDVLR